MKMYETYALDIENVKIHSDEESYEIPGHEAARISKLAPPGKVLCFEYDDAKTMIEMMERGCRLSGDGPCMGWRSSESEYSWINYKAFLSRARYFGSGLIKLGIELDQNSYISIYAQNSVEWLIAQYGCFYYSAIVVPLYDTIGTDSRSFMINDVEAKAVVCDTVAKVMALLERSKETPSLRHIISMQDITEETKKLAMEKGIQLHLFTEVEKLGKSHVTPVKLPKPTDTALICYTSGTTGNPKGAMLSHKGLIAGISGAIEILGDLKPNKDDTSLSYLPLAHIYEQAMQILMFINGGKIGFFRGNVSRLTDDMRVLKPTILPAVPRVLNKIYDKIEASIRKSKINVKQDGRFTEEKEKKEKLNYDPQMFKPILESLGCELRMIICGAAPASEKVLNFYRNALKIEIFEVYGQTECSGPISVNHISEKSVGTIGPPLPCCMVKLVDAPELNYFKENQIGEICVKGPIIFKGYFKDSEKTEQMVDKEGWLHTGDIGMWHSSGRIQIVDRRKHIFKLSQGEYIIPEKIENVYASSPYISQIFVDGDSLQNYLVAIVVPDKEEVMNWCEKNSMQDTWNNICKNSVVKQHILDSMQNMAKSAGLLPFQQVKEIYLHPELLNIEEGHLTPTGKIKRYFVRKLFMEQIQSMYNRSPSA